MLCAWCNGTLLDKELGFILHESYIFSFTLRKILERIFFEELHTYICESFSCCNYLFLYGTSNEKSTTGNHTRNSTLDKCSGLENQQILYMCACAEWSGCDLLVSPGIDSDSVCIFPLWNSFRVKYVSIGKTRLRKCTYAIHPYVWAPMLFTRGSTRLMWKVIWTRKFIYTVWTRHYRDQTAGLSTLSMDFIAWEPCASYITYPTLVVHWQFSVLLGFNVIR